ncbi:MAG: MFS transporter [Gammaproteobacteria bacterium]
MEWHLAAGSTTMNTELSPSARTETFNLKRLLQPRLIVTCLLAFASGLPLALTGTTLQAWYTTAGLSLMTIGGLSLVGQPYVYKFLWAPALDRYAPPFLSRRRSWIFIFQLLLIATLVGMAFLTPQHSPHLLGVVALMVAFCSASQDIAIDAYRVDLLEPQERGLGAAYLVFGYRVALLVSGGLALVMADHIGWRLTYLMMAALMVLGMLTTHVAPSEAKIASPPTLKAAIVEPWREFIKRAGAVPILLFLLLYKLSDVAALSLSTTFVLRELHFTLTDVGLLYKTLGLIGTLLGSFIGGAGLIRLGLFRGLLIFGLLQGASNLVFFWLSLVGHHYPLLASAIFVESFCSGLGTVALLSLTMALCNKQYTATQYALFSALEAIPRVYMGPVAAWLVLSIGWGNFFLISVACALPALILLMFLKKYSVFRTAHD